MKGDSDLVDFSRRAHQRLHFLVRKSSLFAIGCTRVMWISLVARHFMWAAVCCNVLHFVAVCVAVCCKDQGALRSYLTWVVVSCSALESVAAYVAVCVAMCCKTQRACDCHSAFFLVHLQFSEGGVAQSARLASQPTAHKYTYMYIYMCTYRCMHTPHKTTHESKQHNVPNKILAKATTNTKQITRLGATQTTSQVLVLCGVDFVVTLLLQT